MYVTCEKCGRFYDDAERWTICPHRSLDTTPDAPTVVGRKPWFHFDWSWQHFGFGFVALAQRQQLHVMFGWLDVTFSWGE